VIARNDGRRIVADLIRCELSLKQGNNLKYSAHVEVIFIAAAANKIPASLFLI